MKKQEGISWILDRPASETEELRRKYPDPNEYRSHLWAHDEAKWKQNIEFVHSLGLKCDCVGWSYLDLSRPDAGEILDKIEEFCQKGNWLARGGYGCRYTDFESDWYEVDVPDLREVSKKGGIPYSIDAYKNGGKPLMLGWGDFIPALVSEQCREVCIKNNIQGIDFCWAKDYGKYESVQYAFLYPQVRIDTVACDLGLERKDGQNCSPEMLQRLQQLGGYLPRLAGMFYKFRFHLPDYYRAKDLPKTGFAYIQGHNNGFPRSTLLVHKDTAEILIREKMLSPKALIPALIYDGDTPAGYVEAQFPDPRYIPFDPARAEEMEEEYRKIKSTKRPQRKATDNMALKILRAAKRERKEDFGKRMRKEKADSLAGTAYAPLTPYYLVADGGELSDEYTFLDHASSLSETAQFRADMAKEELTDAPEGIVFGRCADGDRVILTPTGKVVRISHEVPDIDEEWPSPAQFFVDATEDA